MSTSPQDLDARLKAMGERLLVKNQVTRNSDGLGSVDAEELQNSSGARATDQRKVLLGFQAHSLATTKELADLCNLDRVMVARRASDLLNGGLLRRCKGVGKGNREWRWYLTDFGKTIAGKIGDRGRS